MIGLIVPVGELVRDICGMAGPVHPSPRHEKSPHRRVPVGAGEQRGVDTEGGRSPALDPNVILQVCFDLGGGISTMLRVRTQQVSDECER